MDALAHFFSHVAAHRFDLIRQKSAAITGARPTGWVAPASDDDGEQPTPARLRKSGMHSDGCMVETYAQMARHMQGPGS